MGGTDWSWAWGALWLAMAGTASGAVLFADDAESGTNGWESAAAGASTTAVWRIVETGGTPPAHAWWCGPEGAATYADGTNAVDAALTSPEIALGAVPARLACVERYETEARVDDCQILIRTNGAAEWTPVSAARWGDSGGWRRHVVDLAAYTNRIVQLRFRFVCPTGLRNEYSGWWLDEVTVAENTDGDGDGLPDLEEDWRGCAAADPDTDADGTPDGAEWFTAGTDPADAESHLACRSAEASAGGTARVAWASSPGRAYVVAAGDLASNAWTPAGVWTGQMMGAATTAAVPATASAQAFRVTTTDRVAVATSGFGCDAEGRSPLYAAAAVYWGDLHSHTTYSDDALQRQGCLLTPAEALETAVGRLDFVAITDHAETNIPGYYTLEKWTNALAQELAFQAAHPEMVVFPAFEYTKTGFSSPALNWRIPDGNGHKNVIVRDFDCLPPRAYGADVGTSVATLLAFLDGGDARGNYLVIPHHPAKGSEPAEEGETEDPPISMATDWSTNYLRADVCALVEIYSRHGGSEIDGAEEPVHNFRPTASAASALDRWLVTRDPTYKIGIIASTDTHSGRPGDVREETNNVQRWLGEYTGGLAAAWATNGSREALWRSLTGARTYGTSGAKIVLEFTAKLDEALAPMGGTLYHDANLAGTNAAQVNLHVRATGETATNAIARVQIYRNSTCVLDATNAAWGQTAHVDFSDRLPFDFAYYRVKVWQNAATIDATCQWERAWSSPIWIEKR